MQLRSDAHRKQVVRRANVDLNSSADRFAERNAKGFLAVAEEAEIGAQAQCAALVEAKLVRAIDAVPEADVLLQTAKRTTLGERDAAGAAAFELVRNVFARRAGVLARRRTTERRR